MKLTWYLTRATGIVAWAMLAASVLWGYLLSARPFSRGPRPAWTLAVHRFLGALSVLFTGAHLAGLVADTYVHYGPAELFVPMASRWHPLAVAWGVVGLYLLIAVEATSLVMKKLPRRMWLAVHRTSFVLFVLATIHFVAAGTDARGHTRVQLAAVATVTLTLFLYLVRVLSPRAAAMRERRAGAKAAGGHDRGPQRSPAREEKAPTPA